LSDKADLEKQKKAAAPIVQTPAEVKDPALEYSFFVNEPGNSQYNYGLDVSLAAPVYIPGYTGYSPPVTNASADYAPVYSAAAAEMALEHQRDDIQIDPDRQSVTSPAMVQASFAQEESIAQNAFFSHTTINQGSTVNEFATVNQGATVVESATFGQEASVAFTAPSIEQVQAVQDVSLVQNISLAQDVKLVQDVTLAQDVTLIQDVSLVQDALPVQNVVPVQNAIPVLSAFAIQDVAPVQNALPVQTALPVQDTTPHQSASVSQDASSLRSWGVEKPDPPQWPELGDSDDGAKWPARKKENSNQAKTTNKVVPAPLHLSTDKRFSALALSAELAATVDRIYSLVDLDFNGYVDFPEMSSVLSSEHLSESEKSFVRMIYQVGCKILAERPTVSASTTPVLTKDDFRLAFAYQCANTLGQDATAKGILANGKQAKSAEKFTEIKPTLYGDDDYPQMSLQPGAVRLGTMGDAYFAAGVSSLAESRPRVLMRILSENFDHSFSVAFPGAHGNPLEVMPPRPEEIIRYGLVAKFGFWFPLIEKAYGIHLAQKHRLASKLAEPRNEAYGRAAQVIETLTASFTGTLVTADCSAQDLLLKLSDLIARKRIIIAVSSDFVPETSSFAGRAPGANKPYPITGFDRQRGQIFLASVYGHDTHYEEEPMRFTTEQFLQFFKVIYFEQEVAPAVQSSNLMRSTQKQSLNPWKKT